MGKLGTRKRSFSEIRGLIIDALRVRPLNTSEVQAITKLYFPTAKRHLQHLMDTGIVSREVFKVRGDKEVTLWTLKKT